MIIGSTAFNQKGFRKERRFCFDPGYLINGSCGRQQAFLSNEKCAASRKTAKIPLTKGATMTCKTASDILFILNSPKTRSFLRVACSKLK
jgi:hypothetical protein